ncbi:MULTISPECIES: fimbria/pilus outer membrane usher protein [Gammaproteobacteria]|uniref:fimbria/pilus outer membrane usher protein n=1 Tax=Gammaproteobacteria TaxID=1236 RepID=UPI00186724B0|nr:MULTISPECIES: fimbria/pilus outer membrane usher protein [Gammaproteobacteria]
MRLITNHKKSQNNCNKYIISLHNGLFTFRLKKISQAIATVIVVGATANYAIATDYFSPNSLSVIDGQNIADIESLEQFSKPGGQLAGKYRVDIFINNNIVDSQDITFITDETTGQLIPVLTKEDLSDWGVKVDAIPTLTSLAPTQEITDISHYINDAKTVLELNQQKLNISIPQIAMEKIAPGTIPSSKWENGLPALVLNYYYSGSNNWSRTGGQDTNTHYVNFRSSANLGPWRLKNYSTFSENSTGREWKSIETSLERGINSLKSQLIIGDTSTPSDVFDSFQFRGVQLQSDEAMLPSSMRGFAPVIRGIAQSNAEITVKQNNYVIYQAYVAPGAFEIDDLYSTGTSGDLTVIIKEADGTERSFIVPFSSIAIMQREGQFKYSLTGGKFKSNANEANEPEFAQGTAIYGLPKGVTGYTGALLSKDYQSYVAGVGVNLGNLGAFSTDITHANTQKLAGKEASNSGQSYRFQYSKNMMATGTSVTLANYRYSTEGYYSFTEANNRYGDEMYHDNKKNRIQITLSQSLNDYGSVYFSTYQQDYWNRSGKERSISSGYSNNMGGVSYNLNYSYSSTPNQRKSDNHFAFSVSIPLDNVTGSYTSLNSSVTTDNNGNTDMMAGISGSLLENNNLNYSVQQSYGNKENNASGNASGSYRGSYGVANVGYGYDKHSQRTNYGLTGAVVAHPYGVTLSQPIYDSFAIVRAPDAKNVNIQNRTGVSTDWRGYAIVPYLNAYSKNEISLDISTLPDNVELKNNTVTLIPTKGAAMLADYKTHVGYRVLFTVIHNSKPVPFGALAQLAQTNELEMSTGIADENGDVYLSGMPEKGRVTVLWGKNTQDQCTANYHLTAEQLKQHLPTLTVDCR